ncbi:MAG: hypothetical protein ACI9J3_001334 [Parvicellaceae bacterium]|jgi:hypothetical protein
MRLAQILLILFYCTVSVSQVNHWETVVYEDDSWKYTLPTSPVDPLWTSISYNDISWSVGSGGFGYGDGDDNTVIPSGTISCFQRITFNIIDISKVDQAIFNYDYDDDFVAYLNGVEIARGAITGTTPAYNAVSGGLHEAQMYSGGSPDQFILDNVTVTTLLSTGSNVLCIQTHNESGTSSDMSSRAWFQLGINDSSSDYGVVPSWFNPPTAFTDSDLPIVVINTLGIAIPDDPKITANMGIIYNGIGVRNYMSDAFNEYDGYIGIEQRGSSSAGFPKKQYGLETRDSLGNNNNVPLFGMPSENDWILHAPYSDKTLMRNVLTYKLGREMGHWAPRTQFCEVVLNGEYVGVYVFMEKIKKDTGRVDIATLNPIDLTGDELTGGYIVKIDKSTSGGIIEWVSPYAPYLGAWQDTEYQMHYPKSGDIQPAQLNYIETYITDFEDALAGPNFSDPIFGYRPYIDLGTFIDYFISNEVSKNVDGYRLSSYLHKDKDSNGGLLKAGPLWDFNLAWGNSDYCDGSTTTGWELDFSTACGGDSWQNPFWWDKFLRQDTVFANKTNCRWQELRLTKLHDDTLMAWVDDMTIYLDESQQRNFNKWNIHGTYVWPNNYVGNSYADDISYFKQWILDRTAWMDLNMFGTCHMTSMIEEKSVEAIVFPNPARDRVYINFSKKPDQATFSLFDGFGKLIFKVENLSDLRLEMGVSSYPKGMYFFTVVETGSVTSSGKIIVQ